MVMMPRFSQEIFGPAINIRQLHPLQVCCSGRRETLLSDLQLGLGDGRPVPAPGLPQPVLCPVVQPCPLLSQPAGCRDCGRAQIETEILESLVKQFFHLCNGPV